LSGSGPAVIAAALAATGVSPATDADRAGEPLDPVAFFTGASHSQGRLREAFKSERRLTAESVGHAEKDGSLILDQKLAIEGDPLRIRRWRLHLAAPGRYVGTLTDAAGPVEAQVMGRAIRIRYPMKGGLKVESWLTAVPGARAFDNKTTITKWGLQVATLTERIEKR
jgi:hypothetical protein